MTLQVIPRQNAVKVDINLQTLFSKQRDFGLPIFITPENTPGIGQDERVRRYATLTEVAEDWNSTDEVYIMAQTAFAQRPQPGEILIGVRYLTDQPGFLLCEPLESGVDVDTFKTVTDGAFKITIDGAPPVEITGLDFSTAPNLTTVSGIITSALTGVICNFWPALNKFEFQSLALGAASSIKYLETAATGTDISGAGFLNGRSDSASKEVQGLTIGSVVDEAQNIIDVNDEAYLMAFTSELRDSTDIIDVAQWVEALPAGHQLFTTSNNAGMLDPTVFSDIASTLQGLGLNRSWVQYSGHPDDYPEVSALARTASINWSGQDTALTLKFKQLPGITPEDGSGEGAPIFRSAQLNTLVSKNANVYSSMGGLPMIVSEATMASGNYQDEVHFADWLADDIETRVFNILQSATTKIPFTEPGLDQLQIGIEDSLQQGVRNGGLAPTISESGKFVPAFVIVRVPVRNLTPAQRASRAYGGFSFVAYLSGAVHAVKPIIGTLTTVLP